MIHDRASENVSIPCQVDNPHHNLFVWIDSSGQQEVVLAGGRHPCPKCQGGNYFSGKLDPSDIFHRETFSHHRNHQPCQKYGVKWEERKAKI